MTKVLALLLVAVSVGLDNFAASTALGVSGVDSKLRLRVALIFGVFEGVMPIVGLLLGRSLAHDLGSTAKPVAGALLGLAGAYAIVTGLVGDRGASTSPELSVRHLVLIGGALSIDNLVIGFALGAYHVNLVVAAVTIARGKRRSLITGLGDRWAARGASWTPQRAGRRCRAPPCRGCHRSGASLEAPIRARP